MYVGPIQPSVTGHLTANIYTCKITTFTVTGKLLILILQDTDDDTCPLESIENKSMATSPAPTHGNKTHLTSTQSASAMDVDSPPLLAARTSSHTPEIIVGQQHGVKGHQNLATVAGGGSGSSEKENLDQISPVTACSRPCEKKKLKFGGDPVAAAPQGAGQRGVAIRQVQWAEFHDELKSPPPVAALQYTDQIMGECMILGC